MKYLLIAALIALVFVLIYRRIRPYIQLFQKITGVASEVLNSDQTRPRKVSATNKLSKCDGCGTWVPAERVIAMRGSVYCSHECLESIPAKRKGKLAG